MIIDGFRKRPKRSTEPTPRSQKWSQVFWLCVRSENLRLTRILQQQRSRVKSGNVRCREVAITSRHFNGIDEALVGLRTRLIQKKIG